MNPRPENWARDIYERSRRLDSRPARRGRPRGAGPSRWGLGGRIGVGPPHTDFVTPGPQPAGEGLRRTGPLIVAARFSPTAYAATGIAAQVLAFFGCSVVHGVRAPRLAVPDRPSPSRPFIPIRCRRAAGRGMQRPIPQRSGHFSANPLPGNSLFPGRLFLWRRLLAQWRSLFPWRRLLACGVGVQFIVVQATGHYEKVWYPFLSANLSRRSS